MCGAPPINVRNYLRVRGEYTGIFGFAIPLAELPPRARRIHIVHGEPCIAFGNYLRVRGEYRVGKL